MDNPASTPAALHGPITASRRAVRTFEKWMVVGLLIGMALLPAAESLVRRLLQTGIPGAVLYTQHFTLWVGFLGALLATGGGKHLALATGEMLPQGRWREVARIYVAVFTAAVCFLLAYAALVMVHADMAVERTLPGGIPEWLSETIMPLALTLMAIRVVWSSGRRWIYKGRTLLLTLGVCFVGLAFESHANVLVIPGLLGIVLALVLGAPVFAAMAGAAMLLFFSEGTSIAAVPTETFRLVASSTLPAIPLLTAAGYVLAEGGASKRLLRLARAMIGWAPGAVALMVLLICTAFTTITGGSGVTILALGGLVLPILLSEKYPEGFSLGLVTASGSLGLLFFPSLPVLLYAVVARQSPTDLYDAGLVPGVLLLLLVMGYALVVGIRQKTARQPFSPAEVARAFWAAKWEVSLPVLLFLCFRLGLTTIVETASLALLAAIATQSFVMKDLPWRDKLPETLVRSGMLVGAVVLLLGVAMGLTSYLVDAEIPAAVLAWTKIHIESQMVFLLVLNAALLVLGSVLEIYSAIIILAPLLAPMADAYGIAPLHMGVIFLANMELGFLLPPMGLNLILASTRFNQPLARLYVVTAPFLLLRTGGVLLVTYVPFLTMGVLPWIKGLFGG